MTTIKVSTTPASTSDVVVVSQGSNADVLKIVPVSQTGTNLKIVADTTPQIKISSAIPDSPAVLSVIPFPGKTGEKGDKGDQGIQGERGATGETGPMGPAGSTYEHNQTAVASTWNITHNLGFYPNVTIVDSGGSVIEAELWYNNLNSLDIHFSVGMSGKAYLS